MVGQKRLFAVESLIIFYIVPTILVKIGSNFMSDRPGALTSHRLLAPKFPLDLALGFHHAFYQRICAALDIFKGIDEQVVAVMFLNNTFYHYLVRHSLVQPLH